MRRSLSILVAGMLLASVVPGTAMAAVPDYQRVISSRHADASPLTSIDGCILTEFFISGMDAVYGGRPGPVDRQGLTGVGVRQRDVCGAAVSMGRLGLFAAGGGGGELIFDGLGSTLDRLGSSTHFDRAWLTADVPVVNEVPGSGEEVVVSVDLTWSLVGELARDTGHLHVRVPGEGSVNSHQNTLMGEATVSGTIVMAGHTYVFDGIEGFHLEQVKYGCQVVAHPSAGEPDLSC